MAIQITKEPLNSGKIVVELIKRSFLWQHLVTFKQLFLYIVVIGALWVSWALKVVILVKRKWFASVPQTW